MQDYNNKVKNEKDMYIKDYTNKYLKYKSKYNNGKNMYGGGGEDITTKLIYFGASWCGYCKSFNPTWDRITSGDVDYSKNVEYVKYDIDDRNAKPMFSKYNIKSFPTVVLVQDFDNNTRITEYQGNRNYEDIQNFIKKST